MSMLAVTRKSKIKDIVLEKKSVTVTELSKLFSVTEETIRRDLKQLEDDGFLTRTYGGAFIQDGVENNVDLTIRETAYMESKIAIAKRCLSVIHNGDSIFLDASTTALQISKELQGMRLTVVTNSLLIINELQDKEDIRLISIGGAYTPRDKAFVGSTAIHNLESFYVDKTFMSCRSVSMEHGITDSNEAIAAIRQTLITRSNHIYLVADHSKFDKTSFIRISGFEAITGLITDKQLDDQWLDYLSKNNVELLKAGE
jgi:DeoR/GlpR family transcriptional regulator of sugar metabolism